MSDVNTTDTEGLGKSADSVSSTTTFEGHNAEYWFEKYRGVTKKQSKTETEKEALQRKYDDFISTHEDELAKVRKDASGATGKLSEYEKTVADLNAEKAQLTASLARFETDKVTRLKVAEKFPALRGMYDQGDLKTVNDFEDEAKYDAYLERISKLVTAENKDRSFAEGTLPKVGASGSGSTNRTAKQISDELWDLDKRNPLHAERYEALEKELAQIG